MDDILKKILLQQREEDEKKKQKHDDDKPVMTREQIIERYNNYLSLFINKIVGEWFKELIDEKLIVCDPYDIVITEERLGVYPAVGLKAQVGRALLDFRPIGTCLIGTIGRIDMYVNTNPSPSAMFILAPEKAKSPRIRVISWSEGEPKPEMPREPDLGPLEWKYVERDNRMHYVSLDKQSFEQIILKSIR